MVTAHQDLIDDMTDRGHELVVHGQDPETGLRAIIAVHSTALGPALGGTRFYPYRDASAALADVLRLAEGMSLKSAAAGLRLGGGKAVIIGSPEEHKTPALLRAYGRLVDSLGGRYITAEDVGTTVDDMVEVASQTQWVTGLPHERGGSGDPSPMTARGVVAAMRAAARHRWGTDSLAGRRVAIQGVGKVGAALADLLAAEDVELIVSDIDPAAADRARLGTGAEVAAPSEILATPCDILAPCALGGVLSRDTSLGCEVVVGSANNQLTSEADARHLHRAGILYVPDFIANAGGVVNISVELEPAGYATAEAARRVDRIFDATTTILDRAAGDGISPLTAAMHLARQRLSAARREGAA